jgi:hypothetical protein
VALQGSVLSCCDAPAIQGYAAVRDLSGLCDHVDERGARMRRPGPLFDLDVFHKGHARARDARGWFFIDTRGRDVLQHRTHSRFAQLEPFYNGVAVAQQLDGVRVLLSDEDLMQTDGAEHDNTALQPGCSEEEHCAALHELAVAYWPPFALRMGLDAGLAGAAAAEDGAAPQHADLREQLIEAWQQLGLLDATGALTQRGRLLQPGCVARERADFWLGPMLQRWTAAALGARSSLPQRSAAHLFAEPRVQRVLDSYARDDWAGLAAALPLPASGVVIDLGGGQGSLARAIKARAPHLACVLAELPPVAAQAAGACAAAGVSCISADLLDDAAVLPAAQLFILARVLHDWPDAAALRMLRAVRRAAAADAVLCVVERDRPAGLLSLHMHIVHGARERSAADWRRLFERAGWEMRAPPQQHAAHAVMTLHPAAE